jgi:hypothetical protein
MVGNFLLEFAVGICFKVDGLEENLGKILKSLKANFKQKIFLIIFHAKLLKLFPKKNHNNLSENGKNFLIHRLVSIHFIQSFVEQNITSYHFMKYLFPYYSHNNIQLKSRVYIFLCLISSKGEMKNDHIKMGKIFFFMETHLACSEIIF